MPSYGHQPGGLALPGWFLFLRIAQGALALLILILTAVAASKFLGGVDVQYLVDPYPGFGFAWFAFAWTVVYLPIAVFVLPKIAAKFKPMIIVLVLELLSTLWWLVTFALLADDSRKLGLWINELGIGSYWDGYKPALGMTQASAVIGAVEFVLFAVASAVIIINMVNKHKDTQFNAPTVNVQEWTPQVQPPHGTELAATRYP
ncbi:uncharacterized protein Z518_10701 [Rhinocladiella mackenziei CBS 650.93]|uniref:MARVEL domain-containing protein n=1 Tax=Rhinocladiella mackenziei CBS 650.93 TaxID=1442369 RepID=A0A0D2I204_9EURO|nr:uncharacterized protein Z518_10701 [Rhinocladiella mackenziei CBS 650.93]KIW99773.1 hypothetical protein Z518_10701 [Rhinocladiella mackenziei CBS 650.93]